MNLPNRKALIQLAIVSFLLCRCGLDAQTFSLPFDLNVSSNAVDFAIDANGNMLIRGTLQASGPLSPLTTAAGSQMLWSSANATFMAGYFSSAPTISSMGKYSVEFGSGQGQTGAYSTSIASGSANTAFGSYATAIGLNSSAGATYAFSFCGHGGGNYGATFRGYETGLYSLSIGQGATASGNYSTAFGQQTTTATGYFAAAVEIGAYANGSYSLALGAHTTANAQYSTAAGLGTTSGSYVSFVTGEDNLDLSESGATPSATAWVANDPIFEVGNAQGTGSVPLSTALVVYKNGDAVFPAATGTVTAPHFITTGASGDIPMYSGN